MKRLIYTGCMLILAGLCFIYREELTKVFGQIRGYFLYNDISIVNNEYYREYDFEYVQNTDDFKPSNKQDIINIFYSVINSGEESFTFYCPNEYSSCIEDVKSLANDQALLSHINNFVHPFNGFKHIETEYTNLGDVTITIGKSYTDDDINLIKQKVSRLSSELVNTADSNKEKIKIIHDYVINNTKYDSDRSDFNIINYKSDIAYGPLFEGYAICGGYSDTMALFLEEFGIKNYKVSSESHVWNAVYLDGQWYHLDLTWDDPVSVDGFDVLDDEFFMISTTELLEKNVLEHDFDYSIYLELKEA